MSDFNMIFAILVLSRDTITNKFLMINMIALMLANLHNRKIQNGCLS